MSSAVPSFKRRTAAVNRRPLPPYSGQLSFGGSDSRHEPRRSNPAVAPPSPTEEMFSLVPGGDSPAFSMIIKLAPSMVDEIRRMEAEGGKARIKFDSNSNSVTSTGNIIEVGGREFRFMWSLEDGDLCDIYEERRSGEDGNGLLVESGCAWRKLKLQRILDDSTKKHVKKMSEEAERKLRSRVTIVLEPGNPSMKSLAAVDAASQKNYNKKKEAAPEKRNLKNFQVGRSSKSTHAPGSSSGTSYSPLSFIPDQPTSASPLGAINISKITDDSLPSQMIGKLDGNAGYEKGIFMMTFNAIGDTSRGKANGIAKPIDLQSMLISLLKNKHHGLTLKALEKAVQVIVPNPLEKIKPILRNIARYKSPGRYILLPGVDFKSLNKPDAEIGSSPNCNLGQKAGHQEFHDCPAPSGGFKEKASIIDLEEQVQLNCNVEEDNALGKNNVQHALPCIFGGEKGADHSKGQGDNNSNGESDSDSKTDTASHSSSSARGGSGGSSDSECDASFNSKEGFNEDVDIMSIDEEKEPKHKTEASETKLANQLERKMAFQHAESRANPSEKGKLKVVYAERTKKFGVRQDIELEGCSESNTRAPTNLLEEVSGRGKDPTIAVENNGDYDDDSHCYLKYEKNEPEFKEPIKTMAQYQEYVKEYNEKYPDYASLLKNLEGFRNNFEHLCKDLEEAKDTDEDRYREILGRIKETYECHVPHNAEDDIRCASQGAGAHEANDLRLCERAK